MGNYRRWQAYRGFCVGIGKGEAKPYTLKINGEEKTVKPVNSEVVNGFYSPLEKNN